MKEPVTQFNLEAAFKALDELDIPETKAGKFKANRVNLKERLHAKSQTDALLEDYYDINDTNDLEQASSEREAEVAKAKLARIEKIVDLDAETEDDILPSYEGKVIVQCPQCMTLFYKNPEDVEASEEDDSVVNVGEVCQHCGNESGYSVIGKVAAVEPEVEEPVEAEPLEGENENEVEAGENESATDTDDLIPAEASAEEEPKEEDNLDLAELPAEDEEEAEASEKEEKEEPEEEKKEESLNGSSNTILTEEAKEAENSTEAENNAENIEEVEDIEESELISSIDILKTKLDIHGDGDKIIIAEKDQLDNEEAPKIEFTVSEEEFDTLAKDFHEDDETEEEAEAIEKAEDSSTDEVDEVTEIDDEEEVTESISESTNQHLTEDSSLADFKELMTSDEFKTPISDTEVKSYFKDTNESLEEAGMIDVLGKVEEVDDTKLEACITESLTNVYSNIKSFTLKECSLTETNLLKVSGNINFKSGNSKATSYIFKEALTNSKNSKYVLKGINENLAKNGHFELECNIKESMLTPSSFTYSYHIGTSLVEGFVEAK